MAAWKHLLRFIKYYFNKFSSYSAYSATVVFLFFDFAGACGKLIYAYAATLTSLGCWQWQLWRRWHVVAPRTGIGTLWLCVETALPVISTGSGRRQEARGMRQAVESERVINARLKQHNLVPGLWPKHKQCPW